jgi:hypothetical protein
MEQSLFEKLTFAHLVNKFSSPPLWNLNVDCHMQLIALVWTETTIFLHSLFILHPVICMPIFVMDA